MWVIATLTILAILIITILLVPLDLVLHMDVYGRPRFRMRLAWLFGLVDKEITVKKRRREEKRRKVEGKPKLKEITNRVWSIIEILRTKGLLAQFKRLLKDLLGGLEIRDLGADFRLGLYDPADAGLLFAVIGPATAFLNSSFPYHLRLQPSFDDEANIEGYADGTVRVRPYKVVTPMLRFVFSLAVLRAVNGLISTRWKKRK